MDSGESSPAEVEMEPREPFIVAFDPAGKILGVGKSTVRRLVVEGDLVPVRIRKRTYVLRSSIEDLMRLRCGGAKAMSGSTEPVDQGGA